MFLLNVIQSLNLGSWSGPGWRGRWRLICVWNYFLATIRTCITSNDNMYVVQMFHTSTNTIARITFTVMRVVVLIHY